MSLPTHLSSLRWLSKIPLAVSHLELAWLYHEIGRSFHGLGDWENTLKYGLLSLDKSNLGMDETWQLNANILVAKAYSGLWRLSESTETYGKALEISKVRPILIMATQCR